MQARINGHFYEDCLKRAIEARIEDAVLAVIPLITGYAHEDPPRLTVIRRDIGNFLSYSLTQRLPRVAMTLLETRLFDRSPDILFSTNSEGQTLLVQGTLNGYTDFVGALHARNTALLASLNPDELKQSPGYRIWQKADRLNNTPLHYAVIVANPALITLFTDLIKAEPDSSALVNCADENGDTPLHMAIRNSIDPDLIGKLLACGADLGRHNQEKISPFGLLCLKDEDTQIAWLLQWHKEDNSKKLLPRILRHYKEYLASHPHDKKISRVFNTVTGLALGLKALTVSHLEVDPEIKIRNAYHIHTREDGFILKLMYRTKPVDARILRDGEKRDDILYLYLENHQIMMASRDNENKVQRINIDEDLKEINTGVYRPIKEVLQDVLERKQLEKKEWEALAGVTQYHGYKLLVPPYKTQRIRKFIEHTKINDPELAAQLPLYLTKLSERGIFGFREGPVAAAKDPAQLFTQDRNTFSALITDIENYIHAVSLRQPVNIWRRISVIVPLVSWLIYGGIETWLIISRFNEQPNLSYEGKEVPLMSGMPRDVGRMHYDDIWCEQSPHLHSLYEAYRYGRNFEEDGYTARFLGKCIDIQSYVYFWSCIGFGILAGVANIAFSFILPGCLWFKKPVLNISATEWQEILQSLQKNILEKLEQLNDNDVPVKPGSIDELADVSSQFNDRKTKEETIAIFTRLLNLLTRLRSEMDQSQKPFSSSIYAPQPQDREIVIDMDSSSSDDTSYSEQDFSGAHPFLEDDEELLLLDELSPRYPEREL